MDIQLNNVLRISEEPYRYIPESEVHQLLMQEPERYLEYLDSSLQAIARNRETAMLMPSKQLFEDDEGDFRLMPCITVLDDSPFKTVKIIGTNLVQKSVPDQITVGKAFVLDPKENYISHIVEACLLSSIRTAACAWIAASRLASRRESIGIIGAGRVGFYAAWLFGLLPGVREIQVSDPRSGAADAAIMEAARRVPGVAYRAVENVSATDITVLATTSSSPFYAPPGKIPNLVISLGADAEKQRELTDDWPSIAGIYVDSLDCMRYGDLLAWKRRGLLENAGNPIELLDLMQTQETTSSSPRIFVSTGTALFDNLTLRYLVQGM